MTRTAFAALVSQTVPIQGGQKNAKERGNIS